MPGMYANDHWTVDIETLGFKPAGEQLAKMILLAPPPFAIGVNGKWGSGKTSLMRYAMARLGGLPIETYLPGQTTAEGEIAGREEDEWQKLCKSISVLDFIDQTLRPDEAVTPEDERGREEWEKQREKEQNSWLKENGLPIHCIWFNPWQYQNDPNPLIPLLHEIRAQFNAWRKAQGKAGKTVKVAVESGLELISNMLGFSASKAREIGERVENENLETITDAQRFNLLFEQAVKLLLGRSPEDKETKLQRLRPDRVQTGRLVIFIDDLDRCRDDQVLKLLEAIKLYLSTRHCIFVLGIDRSAVERAVCRVLPGVTAHPV